jgi:hypothetical protein
MKTILSLFLLPAVLLVSCGEKKKEVKDELYDKVMAVHDEVMPKMGDIMKLKKQLKGKIDELSSEEVIDSAKISQLEQAIADLDNSHEGMMGWMHEFNNNFDGMVNEEIMKYLNEQMDKIQKVGEVTNAALKNAQDKLDE